MMMTRYRRGRHFFKRGGHDVRRPMVTTTSSTSPTTHTLKAEVTEAWKRRRKKKSAKIAADRYYRLHSRYYRLPVLPPKYRASTVAGLPAPGIVESLTRS